LKTVKERIYQAIEDCHEKQYDIENIDLSIDVNIALQQLPQNERRAVVLEHWGYSQCEIGEFLGFSQRGVGKMIDRAKEKLRKILA